MTRPPARLVLFAAAVLTLALGVLAFALTGRHDTTATPSGPTAGPVVVATPSTPVTTPAAPVPANITPSEAATSAAPGSGEPGEDPSEPGTPAPDGAVLEAGTAFAAAWLNSTDPEWPTKLAARSTAELAPIWSQADPTTVPPGRVGGPIVVRPSGDGLAYVDVPVVDSKGGPVGLLTVEVTLTGGRWLVSDVDWRPAR